MTIEAAMGKAGLFHDVADRDAVKPKRLNSLRAAVTILARVSRP